MNISSKRVLIWFTAIFVFITSTISFITIKYTFVLFENIAMQNDKDYSILYINLIGSYPETPVVDPISAIIERELLTVEDIIQAIKKAKYDDNIDMIFLCIYPTNIGWARTTEIRKALESFKKNEKPIYVFLNTIGDKEYYLASIADSIYISPTGNLMVDGLSTVVFFYSNLMNNIGIEWEVIKAGDFKNAPEVYTDTSMSDENRLTLVNLLTGTQKYYVEKVIQSRGKRFCLAFEQIIQNGPYIHSQRALDFGLVDRLDTRQNIENDLNITDNFIEPKEYLFTSLMDLEKENVIGLIFIDGEIVKGENSQTLFGQFSGSYTISKSILDAVSDSSVKAIVIRINSPGGDIDASYAIGKSIELAKAKKPVIISMGDIAASGGYFISMYSDYIVASELTITGSIGVFMIKPNFSKLLSLIGISVDIVKTEPSSDFLSPYRALSEREKEIIENYVKESYSLFINELARTRGLDTSFVESIAQGKVWSGIEAYNFSLIDTLGGLDLAMKIARKKAGIPIEQSVGVIIYPEPEFQWNRMSSYTGLFSELTALTELMSSFRRESFIRNYILKEIIETNENIEIKYLLPGKICIE